VQLVFAAQERTTSKERDLFCQRSLSFACQTIFLMKCFWFFCLFLFLIKFFIDYYLVWTFVVHCSFQNFPGFFFHFGIENFAIFFQKSNKITWIYNRKNKITIFGRKMTNFDVKRKKKHCHASFVLIEYFLILKFVMSSHWRSSTRGISQIWLQVRKESRKF
jgi:hypothetical protein